MSYRRLLVAVLAAGAAVVPTAEAAAAPRYALGERNLAKGMAGSDVRVLQRYLSRVGLRTSADGHFGPKTARKVRQWHRRTALPTVDGVMTTEELGLLRDQVTRGVRLQAVPAPPAAATAPAPAPVAPTATATIGADGLAVAPADAPEAVKQIIAAGNQIHAKPYKYGGGHGRWIDSGYDCSGSVSYALHGAGLLKTALDSTGFMSWGEAGEGQWVTIYGNPGHAYMVVAGLRYDTSGRAQRGSRWTTDIRAPKGFVARHPAGL